MRPKDNFLMGFALSALHALIYLLLEFNILLILADIYARDVSLSTFITALVALALSWVTVVCTYSVRYFAGKLEMSILYWAIRYAVVGYLIIGIYLQGNFLKIDAIQFPWYVIIASYLILIGAEFLIIKVWPYETVRFFNRHIK